jgi:hypothetical protein
MSFHEIGYLGIFLTRDLTDSGDPYILIYLRFTRFYWKSILNFILCCGLALAGTKRGH